MVAKVYGRFVPSRAEWDRWEGAAAALDAEKWPDRVATDVATEAEASKEEDEKSPASPWESGASDDSRGGTRTLDPGIMSAVL